MRLFTFAVACGLFAIMPSAAKAGRRTIVGDHFYEILSQTRFVCGNVFQCRLESDITPPDRYLNITQVACFVTNLKPVYLIELAAFDIPDAASNRSIQVSHEFRVIGDRFYTSFNDDLEFKVGKSRYFRINLQTTQPDAYRDLQCSITGRLSVD